MNWIKQGYSLIIPAYPIGYMLVHGFRDDNFFSKFYVERSHFPANDYLKQLVENELDKLESVKNTKLRVDITDDLEPRVFGGFFLNNGAEVQFPLRVSFDDVEEARRHAANLELDLGLPKYRRKIEMGSDIGDELVSRMMLSEAAKKFIVQRQLQIANSGQFFCAPIFIWGGVSTVSYALVSALIPVAGAIASILVGLTFTVGVFSQIMKGFDSFLTTKADELAVKSGDIYFQGAKDYFLSTMKFNRLMRKVLAEDGETAISKSGDIKNDIVTYSQRLKNVEQFVKKQQK